MEYRTPPRSLRPTPTSAQGGLCNFYWWCFSCATYHITDVRKHIAMCIVMWSPNFSLLKTLHVHTCSQSSLASSVTPKPSICSGGTMPKIFDKHRFTKEWEEYSVRMCVLQTHAAAIARLCRYIYYMYSPCMPYISHTTVMVT